MPKWHTFIELKCTLLAFFFETIARIFDEHWISSKDFSVWYFDGKEIPKYGIAEDILQVLWKESVYFRLRLKRIPFCWESLLEAIDLLSSSLSPLLSAPERKQFITVSVKGIIQFDIESDGIVYYIITLENTYLIT